MDSISLNLTSDFDFKPNPKNAIILKLFFFINIVDIACHIHVAQFNETFVVYVLSILKGIQAITLPLE